MFTNHFEDQICLVLQFIIVHMSLVVSVQWETLLHSRNNGAEEKVKHITFQT